MHLELSASSMFILIVSSFPIPRHLYIEKGMMLELAPKSAKALLKSNLPIEQGRIKLPGSFSFDGSWLRKRAEHLRFILTSSFSIVNSLLVTGFPWFYGLMLLWYVVRAFWERKLGERTVLYSGLLFVLGRGFLDVFLNCFGQDLSSSIIPVKRRCSSKFSISDLFNLFNFLIEGTILVELTVRSAQTLIEDIYLLMTVDVMIVNIFKLLRGLGRWAIHLDKGLFEEIPCIDSSWGESVHPSFCGSSKNKGKNSEHDCVFRNSRNIE
ncbi:hypothetical protein Tco_0626375 [Tanacetum coccineum]|uniref:Uncharacterized protein n=1 Tax=Tanacetum coccineum TaxID=301880 RepID=A0ABQ4WJG2_9ASTR